MFVGFFIEKQIHHKWNSKKAVQHNLPPNSVLSMSNMGIDSQKKKKENHHNRDEVCEENTKCSKNR